MKQLLSIRRCRSSLTGCSRVPSHPRWSAFRMGFASASTVAPPQQEASSTKKRLFQLPQIRLRPVPEGDAQLAQQELEKWQAAAVRQQEMAAAGSRHQLAFAYPKTDTKPLGTVAFLVLAAVSTGGLQWALRDTASRDTSKSEEKANADVDTLLTVMRDPIATSFVHCYDPGKIQVFLAGSFFLTATFVEKLRGTKFLVALVLGSTVLSNAALNRCWDTKDGERKRDMSVLGENEKSSELVSLPVAIFGAPPAIGTNPGLTALCGWLVASKMGRCAVWRGVWLPLGWACFAPLLVYEGLQFRDWVAKLSYACRRAAETDSESHATSSAESSGRLELLPAVCPRHSETAYRVALAAQLKGEDGARKGVDAEAENGPSRPLLRVDDNGVLIDMLGFLIGAAVAAAGV